MLEEEDGIANSGQNAMLGRFAFLGRAFSKIFHLKIDELKATISVDRSGVFLFGASESAPAVKQR